MTLAMRRTGHHGIINWLCQQTDTDSMYWDMCQIEKKKGPLRPIGRALYYDSKKPGQPKEWRVDFNGINFSYIDNCFISIETFGYVTDYRIKSLEEVTNIKNIQPTAILLMNRDFFNWLGSCMTLAKTGKGGGLFERRYDMVKTWKIFIKESLSPNVLKDFNVVDINYNKWFSDKKYRKELCDRLELKFTDDGLNQMLRGSTFDRYKYQNDAQNMPVFQRYKQCLKDEDYLELIDDEIIKLSREYFGFVPKEFRK